MDVVQFRDFYVRGSSEALDRYPEAVDTYLDDGWSRNPEVEARARGMGETYFVYSCTASEDPPRVAADLIVARHSDGWLYVPNVIPSETDELSPAQYNAIVGEFADQFGIPAAVSLDLEHELTPFARSIESYFSDEAFTCLRRFSRLANQSTGSSHPLDRERWHAFLIAVHRSGRPLATSVMEQWLVREEGWTPDQADRLGSQASFGVGLLAAYDAAQ